MSTIRASRGVNLCRFATFARLRNVRIISFSVLLLNFTLLALPSKAALNAPSNLSAPTVSSNQIDLTWTDNSSSPNETNFRIERSTNNSTFAEIGTANHDVTNYSDTTVSADRQYWYRVRGYKSPSTFSNYSNTNNVVTP